VAARQRLAICRRLQECGLLGWIGNSQALHLRERCEPMHPVAVTNALSEYDGAELYER